VLISTELMLNAVVLNFAVFNRFIAPNAIDGELMSIFIIAVAAAEAVVGMAIFVAIFKYRRTLDVTHLDIMKG
jgi:NADH:ubiquinone oxidoreductase subunit K